MSAPIRRNGLDLDGFAEWLELQGAEVGKPTNPYEAIRYRAMASDSGKSAVHIIYAKQTGLLTYTGDSKGHYEAFMGDLGLTQSKVRRPKKTGGIRAKLIKRDGECCWYCGGLLSSAESNIEHLIAISDGGTNALANLVLTHTACNTEAGNLPLSRKLELRARKRGVSA